MQELIQIIKCLDEKELNKINSFVDTLPDFPSTVFGRDGEDSKIRRDIRSSSGRLLKEDDKITDLIHKKMNAALEEYKLRVQKINDIFNIIIYN